MNERESEKAKAKGLNEPTEEAKPLSEFGQLLKQTAFSNRSADTAHPLLRELSVRSNLPLPIWTWEAFRGSVLTIPDNRVGPATISVAVRPFVHQPIGFSPAGVRRAACSYLRSPDMFKNLATRNIGYWQNSTYSTTVTSNLFDEILATDALNPYAITARPNAATKMYLRQDILRSLARVNATKNAGLNMLVPTLTIMRYMALRADQSYSKVQRRMWLANTPVFSAVEPGDLAAFDNDPYPLLEGSTVQPTDVDEDPQDSFGMVTVVTDSMYFFDEDNIKVSVVWPQVSAGDITADGIYEWTPASSAEYEANCNADIFFGSTRGIHATVEDGDPDDPADVDEGFSVEPELFFPPLRGSSVKKDPTCVFITKPQLIEERINAELIIVPEAIASASENPSRLLAAYLAAFLPCIASSICCGQAVARSDGEPVGLDEGISELGRYQFLHNLSSSLVRMEPVADSFLVLLPVSSSGGKANSADEALFLPQYGPYPIHTYITPATPIVIHGTYDDNVPVEPTEVSLFKFIASWITRITQSDWLLVLRMIAAVDDRQAQALDILSGLSVMHYPVQSKDLPTSANIRDDVAVTRDLTNSYQGLSTFTYRAMRRRSQGGTVNTLQGQQYEALATADYLCSSRTDFIGQDCRWIPMKGGTDSSIDLYLPTFSPYLVSAAMSGFLKTSTPKNSSNIGTDLITRFVDFPNQVMTVISLSQVEELSYRLEEQKLPAGLLDMDPLTVDVPTTSVSTELLADDFLSSNAVLRARAIGAAFQESSLPKALSHSLFHEHGYSALATGIPPSVWPAEQDFTLYAVTGTNTADDFRVYCYSADLLKLYRPVWGFCCPVTNYILDQTIGTGANSFLVRSNAAIPQKYYRPELFTSMMRDMMARKPSLQSDLYYKRADPAKGLDGILPPGSCALVSDDPGQDRVVTLDGRVNAPASDSDISNAFRDLVSYSLSVASDASLVATGLPNLRTEELLFTVGKSVITEALIDTLPTVVAANVTRIDLFHGAESAAVPSLAQSALFPPFIYTSQVALNPDLSLTKAVKYDFCSLAVPTFSYLSERMIYPAVLEMLVLAMRRESRQRGGYAGNRLLIHPVLSCVTPTALPATIDRETKPMGLRTNTIGKPTVTVVTDSRNDETSALITTVAPAVDTASLAEALLPMLRSLLGNSAAAATIVETPNTQPGINAELGGDSKPQ